jgi:hypothetical protein
MAGVSIGPAPVTALRQSVRNSNRGVAQMARASGGRAQIGPLLFALVLATIAAAPRFIGLDVGRVFAAAHPDELPVAVAQSRSGALEPGWYLIAYGGGYHVPLHIAVRALGAAGLIALPDAGSSASPEQIQRFLIALRGWSAALSTAAVALVFVAGRAAGGTGAGVIAALVLAAAPTAVRDAHLAKADAAATFAASLVIASLALPWRRRAALPIALGVSCGLAFSTKYTIALAPAALLAIWRPPGVEPGGAARRLLWSGAAAATTVLALNWFWVSHFATCWSTLRDVLDSQFEYVRNPWLHDALRSPFAYHTMVSLRYGCGGLVALLTAPALVAALARPGAQRWVAVAVVGQLALLMVNPLVVSRNLSPSVPGIAVVLGWSVARIVERASAPWRIPALALAAALLVAAPSRDALRMALAMREMDTRGQAAEWIAAHVPANAALIGFGGPPDYSWGLPDVGGRRVYRGLAPARWRSAASYVIRYRYPIAWASQDLPPDARLGAPVAVFDPFADGADPIVEPLDAFYLPLARFAGVQRPGPRIEIYSLAEGASAEQRSAGSVTNPTPRRSPPAISTGAASARQRLRH